MRLHRQTRAYLQLPETTGQPPRRLVGFYKVHLYPSAQGTVEIVLDSEASNHPLSVIMPNAPS